GFDEGGVPVGEQGAGGVVKADGVAQVVIPVPGVQGGAVERGGGQGGVEGSGRAGGDALQRGQKVVFDGLDVWCVGGIVDRQPPGPYPGLAVVGEEGVDGGGVAGDHGGGGGVDGGDVQAVIPGQVGGDLLGRQRD